MVRAISFDVGGTLIEPRPSVGHVYAAVAHELGLGNHEPAVLNRQFLSAWKARADFNYSQEEWRALVEASFEGLCPRDRVAELFPKVYERFADKGPWHVFEDVWPTFEALRQRGIPIAITSNWDERLRPLLRQLEFETHAQVIVVSREIGHHKPSPKIFHATCQQLAFSPNEVFHVGDSVREDLNGARNAGLQAALIDRHQPSSSPHQWNTLLQSLRLWE